MLTLTLLLLNKIVKIAFVIIRFFRNGRNKDKLKKIAIVVFIFIKKAQSKIEKNSHCNFTLFKNGKDSSEKKNGDILH